MNIYQKLVEVRKAVPYLKKDNKGHQFQYVSSSQTLGTLKEKMDEQGLLLIPSVKSKTVTDHTTKNGGHEYFTELDMVFTWVNSDKPDEKIECGWVGQGLDSGEKGVGKALTYSEKYFLLKFFNIATDKDDPDSFQKKVERSKPQPNPLDESCKKLIAAISEFSDKHTEDIEEWWISKIEPILNKYSPAQQEKINKAHQAMVKQLVEKELSEA